MSFEETVAVVTGAARGIGRAIAGKLHDLGATVVIVDLDRESVDQAAGEIGIDSTSRVAGYACDVSNADAVEELFKNVKTRFGRLDILVNNAGITRDNLFMRMKYEQWQQVIDVNLSGTFLCSRAAVGLLRKSTRGRIVNLSSVAASGNPGQANYSASKAGVIGFTKTVALELARYGVTVNAVAPGFIDTEMTQAIPDAARENWLSKIPAARPGIPEDIAEAVVFLCSPQASYITGQVLGVDGGLGI